MNVLALVPWWGRLLAVALLAVAIYVTGRVHGADAELARHEAIESKAATAREDEFHRALKRSREAARKYVAFRARAEENKHAVAQTIARAPAQSLYRAECAAHPATDDPVRVTWGFVRLWDAASRADGMPADPGGAAGAAGELSPLGPRELLANHADNTAACEIDRERYRQLIAFIRDNQKETQP